LPLTGAEERTSGDTETLTLGDGGGGQVGERVPEAGQGTAFAEQSVGGDAPVPGGSAPVALEPNRRHRSLLVLVGGALLLALLGVGGYFGVSALTGSRSAKPSVVVPPISSSVATGSRPPPVATSPRSTSPAASSSPATSAASQSAAPPASAPQDIVQGYFAAINSGNYARAWSLGGMNIYRGSYSSFVQGFAGTSFDAVTIVSVDGDTVAIQIDATQSDGTHKYFAGTYTVAEGVIVAAAIQQTGP
jgi:hypothetical protein